VAAWATVAGASRLSATSQPSKAERDLKASGYVALLGRDRRDVGNKRVTRSR
jgi:hypothetical protein